MAIVAVINQKGGSGKTTTAVNLAAAFGQQGKRILLVDLDPDAYATQHLGRTAEEGSIADALLEGEPVQNLTLNTSAIGVDLVPSSIDLAAANTVLVSATRRESRLDRALSPVNDEYDMILIDCPPQLSLLSLNGLVASDHFIVPAIPDFFSIAGLGQMIKQVEQIRTDMDGHCGSLLGVVLTIADYRSNLTKEVEAWLREQLGEAVLQTVVRVNSKLREAQQAGRSIFDHDPKATGAWAYFQLATEVGGLIR